MAAVPPLVVATTMVVPVELANVAHYHGHLCPELVDMSKAANNLRPEKRFMVEAPFWERDRVFVPSTIEEYRRRSAPTGGTSDATAATVEKGRAYHEGLVANLCELIEIAKATEVHVHTRRPLF